MEEEKVEKRFPDELTDEKLEYIYIGLILNDPKAMTMYYFLYGKDEYENYVPCPDEVANIIFNSCCGVQNIKDAEILEDIFGIDMQGFWKNVYPNHKRNKKGEKDD